MKVRYLQLKEATVLPIPNWHKGQAHAYSTFFVRENDREMPGLDLEKDDTEISILQNGVKVAGIPLGNCRGYVYQEEAIEVTAEEVVTTETAPAESPKRRRY